MSKRKAFNFYRSYWDTAKMLSDKDRLAFLDAMFEKQFNGVEPDLKGNALFAWISQKHSIETQIKGYEDKTGQRLQQVENDATKPPYEPPSVGPIEPPSVQEKGKEEEKEEGYITAFNECFSKRFGLTKDRKTQIKKIIQAGYTIEQARQVFKLKLQKWGNDHKMKDYLTPDTLLRFSNFEKYVDEVNNTVELTRPKIVV